jgi:hypothetical protein
MSDATASTPGVNHPLSSRGLFVPLDVNYSDDPKILEVGYRAELLYVRSLAIAKRLASDGAIHRNHLYRIGADIEDDGGACMMWDLAKELVRAGLWVEDGDGWVIAAWDRWNLTAAEVEERKRGKARGAAVANHKRWHEARGVVEPDCSFCADRSSDDERIGTATDSESTETEIEGETERASDATIARGKRIPLPYVVSPEDQEWAEREHPAVDWHAQTLRFVDHFRAKTGKDATKLDWSATWRNWIRRSGEGWR